MTMESRMKRGQPGSPASNEPPRADLVPSIGRILTSGRCFVAVVLVTTILAVSLGALSEQRTTFSRDELIYMRVIRMFGDDVSLELLRTYNGEPASPAPLFFITYAAAGRLFGFTFPVFRTLSLLIALLASVGLWLFLTRHPLGGQRLHFPLLQFIFPYVFCMAFSAMAEPITLLLTVLGLCGYLHGLKRDSDAWLYLGSVALVAAVHVRIHAVFAPAALIVVLLLHGERSILRWGAALTPVLARIPLILLQGGLTVSREAFVGTKPELGFCPSNVNFFLVWLGYMFFPLLWWCGGRRWINLVAAAVLIPFYLLATPDFLGTEHDGILRSVFTRLGTGATATQWLLFPAWLAGCFITLDLVQRVASRRHREEVFLCACIVMFMVSFAFSTVAFERYYHLIVPAIVLLGVPKTRPLGGYAAMLTCHIVFLGLSLARLAKDLPYEKLHAVLGI